MLFLSFLPYSSIPFHSRLPRSRNRFPTSRSRSIIITPEPERPKRFRTTYVPEDDFQPETPPPPENPVVTTITTTTTTPDDPADPPVTTTTVKIKTEDPEVIEDFDELEPEDTITFFITTEEDEEEEETETVIPLTDPPTITPPENEDEPTIIEITVTTEIIINININININIVTIIVTKNDPPDETIDEPVIVNPYVPQPYSRDSRLTARHGAWQGA